MSTPRTARAEETVFAEGPKRSWMVTAVIHGALFGALAVMARHPRARELARAASVVEFDTPPPRRAPPPDPPAPQMPPPAAEPVRTRAPRPAPTPAPAPIPPPNAAPPPIMTAQGNGAPAGDSVPTGNNTNFQGGATSHDGTANRGGDGTPAPAPAPAPDPPRRDGPMDLPDEATAPEPLDDNDQPEYPEALRQSGVQGTVIARFVVRVDGSVAEVRILRGPDELHDAVREALRRWRFRPATLNGHAIAVYRTMPFRFVLENL